MALGLGRAHGVGIPCALVVGGGLRGGSKVSLWGRGERRKVVKNGVRYRGGGFVRALDAAQPFDYESRMVAKLRKRNELKIGLVGFGTFGQFLARRLAKQVSEGI